MSEGQSVVASSDTAGREEQSAPTIFAVVWTVTLTTIIQVLSSLIALSPPVLAPAIAADRGWSPDLIGYYPGFMYAAALAICLFGASVLCRCPVTLSLVSVLVSAAGLALMLGPSIPFLALGALVIGIGYGPVVPATSQVLSTGTPPQYANLIFSVKQTGAPLGGLLAGILVPYLVTGSSSREAGGAIALGAVLVAILMVPAGLRLDSSLPRRAPLQAGLFEPVLSLLRVPSLGRIAVATFTFSGMQLCLGAFLTLYLVQRQRLGLNAAGAVFGISQAASVVGRLGFGYVADRFFSPRTVLLAIGAGIAISSLMVAAFQPSWPVWAMAAVAAVFGATTMGWNGVFLAEVARRAPPGQVGLLTSGAMSINFFGVLVGPLLFTLVLRVTGCFEAGFAFMAALVAAGVALAATSKMGRLPG